MPTFQTPDPIVAIIDLAGVRAAGQVQIRASERGDAVVDVSPGDPSDQDDVEMAKRKQDWKPLPPRYTTGVLAKYARLVTGAERGAVTEP